MKLGKLTSVSQVDTIIHQEMVDLVYHILTTDVRHKLIIKLYDFTKINRNFINEIR